MLLEFSTRTYKPPRVLTQKVNASETESPTKQPLLPKLDTTVVIISRMEPSFWQTLPKHSFAAFLDSFLWPLHFCFLSSLLLASSKAPSSAFPFSSALATPLGQREKRWLGAGPGAASVPCPPTHQGGKASQKTGGGWAGCASALM